MSCLGYESHMHMLGHLRNISQSTGVHTSMQSINLHLSAVVINDAKSVFYSVPMNFFQFIV